jgi:hypothetical protein
MLLNVLGEETPNLLPEQVKDINLSSGIKHFHPRKKKERKRRYLDQPTVKLRKLKKGHAMCKASTITIQLSSVLLHCMLES